MTEKDSSSPSPASIQLIIASNNIHKIQDLRSMLQPYKYFDILSLRDFPHYTPQEEKTNSFEENAISKATHAAVALNSWTLADDSGLIVPVLNGEPGILTSRYAGNDATDADNRKKLLEKMKNFYDQDRYAYFFCCLALASPEGIKKTVTATCEGFLATEERGGGGFGYDPLFLKHDYNKTFAELETSIKNRISHRRKALDKMLLTLESLVE